jgi:preprotein translocase subunit SecG
MLYYSIVTLHVIVCVILVLVVLLQSGKGADLAGAFGGGATQTAFGSRGPASFLSRMTTVAAIVFMLTCLGLTMLQRTRTTGNKSILDSTQQPAAKPITKKSTGKPAVVPTREQIRRQQEEAEAKQKQTAAPAQANPPAEKPAKSKLPATRQ